MFRRLFLLAAAVYTEDFTSRVVAITDSDTIKVPHEGALEQQSRDAKRACGIDLHAIAPWGGGREEVGRNGLRGRWTGQAARRERIPASGLLLCSVPVSERGNRNRQYEFAVRTGLSSQQHRPHTTRRILAREVI